MKRQQSVINECYNLFSVAISWHHVYLLLIIFSNGHLTDLWQHRRSRPDNLITPPILTCGIIKVFLTNWFLHFSYNQIIVVIVFRVVTGTK
jgi:hypothetical protein